MYRAGEKVLGKFLPGMSVSANGYCEGINAAGKGSGRTTPGYVQNWLYATYDPDFCTAGVEVGFRDGFVLNAQKLEIRPSFYYKLLNNFLSVGLGAGMEFGYNNGKSFEDVPYNFWFIEPQVKVNINSSFYAAFVYRYTAGTYADILNKDQKTNWFNIRLCYTL